MSKPTQRTLDYSTLACLIRTRTIDHNPIRIDRPAEIWNMHKTAESRKLEALYGEIPYHTWGTIGGCLT